MSQPPRRRALAGILTLAATLAPAIATADDSGRVPVDWDMVLHEGASSLLPHESWHAETRDQVHSGVPPVWLGKTPRLALIARDWGVSQVLWGHLAVTDQFRLSHSSRMVVTRLRLADGRLTPFVHVGIGQWRADTSVVPSLSTEVQLAGQVGGGFELAIAPRTVIALEADCTALYRESHDGTPTVSSGQALGATWATLLAARARF